jgi:hypothetical protein
MNHMGQFFLKLGLAASMLLWASIAVTPANAATITFNFSGIVTGVGAQLGTSTFHINDAASGSYTFNPATVDGVGGSSIGKYNGTISNLTLNIGSYNATLGAGSNSITVTNNLANLDSYTVNAPVTGATVNGRTPHFFEISLVDPTHTAFNNDHLPTTPPNLASFATHTFRLVFNGGPVATVSGVLTAIPLPAAVILFGAGLVALVGLGAGSWRQKKTSLA